MSSEERGADSRSPRPEEFTLTDPKAMRALAHPVRMALLELFNVSVTLTATQASDVLGESPANCAFHLRTLAKYGLIEEAGGGRGRERPWRRVHASFNIAPACQRDPQARMAAEALGSAFRDRWLDRIRRAFAAHAWDDEWESAVSASNSAVSASNSVRFLTPGETAEAVAKILEIIDSYGDRTDDPSLRPEGALPVNFNVFSYPVTDQPGLMPVPGVGDAREAGPGSEALCIPV